MIWQPPRLRRTTLNRIERLFDITIDQAQNEFGEIFFGNAVPQCVDVLILPLGDESRSNHKQFLVRRVAWRLQAIAEGDLSERARQRALTLAMVNF